MYEFKAIEKRRAELKDKNREEGLTAEPAVIGISGLSRYPAKRSQIHVV